MIRDPRHIVDISEVPPGTEPAKAASELPQSWIERWHRAFARNSNEPINPAQIQLTIRPGNFPELPRHIGLGSGTQLALSAAVGLSAYFHQPTPSTGEIASAMDRAGRSAIGSYGFFQGGFLVDRGVGNDEIIAPLDLRLEFPPMWPIVLVLPEHRQGLSGSTETYAFEKIKPTTTSNRNKMIELVRQQIVPALTSLDYPTFANALYQYGHAAGEHFSDIQNGPYNGPLVTDLVQKIRDLGVPAAGQSSWGPCIFAIARDDDQANALTDRLKSYVAREYAGWKFRFLLTYADNLGAITTHHSTTSP